MSKTQQDEKALEEIITQAGKIAPRITPERIDETIMSTRFHKFPGTTVTVCCLALKNGFNVIGHSACVSDENFDAEIGRDIAYENAREKIWQLEGYLLRQVISETVTDQPRLGAL